MLPSKEVNGTQPQPSLSCLRTESECAEACLNLIMSATATAVHLPAVMKYDLRICKVLQLVVFPSSIGESVAE